MTYIVMAYKAMACKVMAYKEMAYKVMAYKVMAPVCSSRSVSSSSIHMLSLLCSCCRKSSVLTESRAGEAGELVVDLERGLPWLDGLHAAVP